MGLEQFGTLTGRLTGRLTGYAKNGPSCVC
jgi:hypothetical protein